MSEDDVGAAKDRLDIGVYHLYYTYMKQVANKAGKAAATGGQVTFALVHAAQAIEERWQGALAGVGLSTAKLGALTVLVEAGEPLSLSELAARLTCVRSNITQLVDRLDGEGLVRRVENPVDRRSKKAAITPLGIERQAAGAREMERVQRELGSALSAIDLAALERVLSKLR
jgi:DNA-binding MarR family transcriptional regulator